jgi:hypothetical protein
MKVGIVVRRGAFEEGRIMLRDAQQRLCKLPTVTERDRIVDEIVFMAGLRGDNREGYFRLLALSALAGQEKLYNDWDRSQRNGTKCHGHEHQRDNR